MEGPKFSEGQDVLLVFTDRLLPVLERVVSVLGHFEAGELAFLPPGTCLQENGMPVGRVANTGWYYVLTEYISHEKFLRPIEPEEMEEEEKEQVV